MMYLLSMWDVVDDDAFSLKIPCLYIHICECVQIDCQAKREQYKK